MNPASVVERATKETTIRVEARIGTGVATVNTTVPFLDHMLTALAKYSGVDLIVTATGDLRHHIVEDVALTVGRAIAGIVPVVAARYGDVARATEEAADLIYHHALVALHAVGGSLDGVRDVLRRRAR